MQGDSENNKLLKNLTLLTKFYHQQLKLYRRALDLDLKYEISRISKVLENIHKRISEEQNRVMKYYKEDL